MDSTLQVLRFCLFAMLCVGSVVVGAKKHKIFGPKTRLVMRTNNLLSCDEPWNSVNVTMSRSTLLPSGLYGHDFDMIFTEPAPLLANVNIKFVKCGEAVTTNSCEYYKSLELPDVDICRALNLQWSFWRHYFENTTPKITCPMKAGLYQVRNGTTEVDFLDSKGIPLENNIWMTTTNVSLKNAPTPCICFIHEAQFFRVHN